MKYIVIKKQDVEKIVDFLVCKFGFPILQRRLNIYSADTDDLSIEAIDCAIHFKKNSENKYINIKNKNLKQFFKHIQSRNKNGFFINDIVIFNFSVATLLFNTYHGDILSINDEQLIEEINIKFGYKCYDDINCHKTELLASSEFLFDDIGNLNKKIKNYANMTGLDIRSNSASMRIRLSNISNNYEMIEKYFKLITKNDLLSTTTNKISLDKFKNMSIIIPVYNQTIIPTLLSVQGQNISKEQKQKIQVVVVNDGSKTNVSEEINSIKNKLDFQIDVIEFKQNMGLANARNAGMSIAKFDLLLFMDSDIVLSKNYLYDVNIRMQIIPFAIFVAMRKNIETESEILKEKNLLNGIERSLVFDDSRVQTMSKKYHVGWDEAYKNETVTVLDDTNYFKQLSFGSKIGIYDLPSVVTGHNIAINRRMINKYPIFSTEFKGWGFEDTYFAATLISQGCFVIPVISSSVFHINHEPRSGDIKKKTMEANLNFKKYNYLLDKRWEG